MVITIQDILGGRAHLKGVTFYSEDYASFSTLSKNGLDTKITKRTHDKTIFSKLTDIPFIRGIFVLIESLWLAGTAIRALMLTYTLLILIKFGIGFFINIPQSGTMDILSKYNIPPYVIVIPALLALGFVRFSTVGQYHGAEHKAHNVYKSGMELTVENVRKASRVSNVCGSNLMIFGLVILCILINFINFPLSFLISLSFAYEVFRAGSGMKLLKPFYIIGALFQRYIVTAEPTDKQIEVAIASIQKLVEIE